MLVSIVLLLRVKERTDMSTAYKFIYLTFFPPYLQCFTYCSAPPPPKDKQKEI